MPLFSRASAAVPPPPAHPTNWRAVWRLIKPFWVSDQKWKGLGLLVAVVGLALGLVYLNVLFNEWNREFYNALEARNYDVFRHQLWRFSYLAFIYIAVAIYRTYLMQGLEILWRAWMTDRYMAGWLAHRAYYRIEQTRSTDNPDQRIAEDLSLLTTGTLTLGLGLLSSVVSLASFAGILWTLSGPLSFVFAGSTWTVSGYMLWFAIAYAIVGSGLIFLVGRPLIAQNFQQQRFEADFRFGLVRIRENAEAIALYRGEAEERAQAGERFDRIRENWWRIMITTKRLNIASTFYDQFAVIFPFLVGAPRYFAGAIKLGGLMQIASAFGQVQTALSWFVEAFDRLAGWKASVNRLAIFHEALEAVQAEPSEIAVLRNNVGALLLDGLVLKLPHGETLTRPLSAEILPGRKIVVTGPSGCGKSTLFRAMAGIWPHGAGRVELPQAWKLAFVPQKSYLPIGTLRTAIAYPAAPDAYKDLAIRHYLDLARLQHLADRLDEHDNWSGRLSPGEQQRLAIVRVLLARPDALFLDEATSALDADTEGALYELILKTLPDVTLVSIAHREQLERYHHARWRFVRENDDEPYVVARSTVKDSVLPRDDAPPPRRRSGEDG